MIIKYLNFIRQWKEEKKFLLPLMDKVFSKGHYVGVKAEEIGKFEKNICKTLKTNHCVTLNSGTDALTLALYCSGVKKKDEVITTANSYIATVGSIVHLGAKPVFADVQSDQNIDPTKIEKLITKKTKAILVVHLTGRCAKMNEIMKIANKYKIKVIEDCAQSFKSKYKNKFAGTYGLVGCFSAHPLKNLNAMGDGGFIVTKNKKIAARIRLLANHGLKSRDVNEEFGYNSRLDNIQAGILNYRLKKTKKLIEKRREIAKIYQKKLNSKFIFVPKETKNEFNTYHTFVIQVPRRDSLSVHLKKKKISTYIHNPIPTHKQKMFKNNYYKLPVTEMQCKKIISLPIHQYLSLKEINYTIKTINNFFSNE
jgi:dTDP-4-amino-4,6-dideoxygalactose transaminase